MDKKESPPAIFQYYDKKTKDFCRRENSLEISPEIMNPAIKKIDSLMPSCYGPGNMVGRYISRNPSYLFYICGGVASHTSNSKENSIILMNENLQGIEKMASNLGLPPPRDKNNKANLSAENINSKSGPQP